MQSSLKAPNLRREIDLDIDRQQVLEDITCYSRPVSTPISTNTSGKVSLAKSRSSRLVLSGDIIDIEMSYDNKPLKMNQMVDLQWALISILALSGAAGSPELLGEPDHPDKTMLQVHRWLM
jgi:hypothetical protein